MAAYGSGYYGGGNYSYGVSLGEFAVVGASTVAVAGVRYVSGAFAVSCASSMDAGAVVVKFAAADMSRYAEQQHNIGGCAAACHWGGRSILWVKRIGRWRSLRGRVRCGL
jgi:hypothetical protein